MKSKDTVQPRLHVDAARLQRHLSELARFGANPEGEGCSRIAFSEADRAGREWILARMREARLEVWVDEAANLHGRRNGLEPEAPTILFGSHIDTVPKGGNFDGTLGSLGALEVLTALGERDEGTRHPLEMVVWADEEGAHFGKGLFGSRAATRGIDPGELELVDDEGVSLAEWLRRYGLRPEAIDEARRKREELLAYLELHIEQGPFLDRDGMQIGVVEGIVGIHRYDVRVRGFANHAGTTLMDERRDALVAAARLTHAVREEVMARPGRQVGNVGYIKAIPGAANVVPGAARLPIELRDIREEVIEEVLARIRSRAEVISREAEVEIDIDLFMREEPAMMDPRLKELIESAAKKCGFSTMRMPSGAGHDAQNVARLGVPTGMIFVPSRGGVSHAPSEWTDWEDCARGVEVLYRAILALDALGGVRA